ncbi:MAG: hypothetical protein M3010_08240, partial [Candidatus Dormibacteraeota bacterium]|nr:hypothetical protein [Candidatus Dormibacteraeota bacterium]
AQGAHAPAPRPLVPALPAVPQPPVNIPVPLPATGPASPGLPGLNQQLPLPPAGGLGTGLSMTDDSGYMADPQLAIFTFLLGSGG